MEVAAETDGVGLGSRRDASLPVVAAISARTKGKPICVTHHPEL